MKKTLLIGALLALFVATFSPVLAGDEKVKFHAEVTTRLEHVDNFTDFQDTITGSAARDSVDFGFYRTRFGMSADVGDGLYANITLQNHGTWGDSFPFPSNAQDPILGGIWATNVLGSNSTQVYEAWVKWENIGDSLVSAKLGRQEHTLGNELHLGDGDFYGGQYFDGLRLNFDFESWDLDAFYYWIQERSILPGSAGVGDEFPIPTAGGSDDETLLGLSTFFEVAEGHEIEPYILLHKQSNEADFILPKLNLWTIGALYGRPMSHESAFDWSLELAMQSGEIGNANTDVSSMVAEGWFGYTFGDEDASHHRVHAGILWLGDGDDPVDVEFFIPLFPDTHRRAGLADVFSLYSASGYTNQSFPLSSFHNLTDINIGWQWWNDGSQSFGAAYHQFTLTEDFGGPEDDLGSEIDLWYEYNYGKHLGLQVGVANFMPGDLFMPVDDSVLRVWGQAKFRL